MGSGEREEPMDAPIRYGLSAGLAAGLLLALAPQPAGAVLLWVAVGGQTGIGALLVWRRMRLPYATAALTLATCASAMLVFVYSRGEGPLTEPVGWAALGLLFTSGVLLAVLEPRANPAKWSAWRAVLRESSVRDLLLGRHIPDLGSGRDRSRPV